MAFLSHNSSDMPGLATLINVLFWGRCDFQISFPGRDISRIVWSRLYRRSMVGTLIVPNNMRFSLPNVTRHSGELPYTVTPPTDETLRPIFGALLIWTLLPNLTFYLIVLGFQRTFTTDAACQQRTLTPPDTWSWLDTWSILDNTWLDTWYLTSVAEWSYALDDLKWPNWRGFNSCWRHVFLIWIFRFFPVPNS